MEDQKDKTQSEQDSEKVILDELSSQFSAADTAFKELRDGNFSWDERENLFFGKYKHPEEKTKSVLSTGELTTLAIDGACRVMAQLPIGRFYNYDGKTGSNMIMNLLFEHYVLPNATTGGPLLLKNRLADLYSRVFPYVPMFIDWKVVKGGYIGPDPILIHPRRFRGQPGKIAIEDMEWCFVDTEVSKDWLKSRNKKFWKNIDEVLKLVEEGKGTPEEDRSPKEKGKTKTGITLRHRLKSDGQWTVYAPFEKNDKILVDEKDYFPGIPIALKLQYPTLDQLAGFTDFDRGEGNQKSIDSAIRLRLDSWGMVIDPPLKIDPEQVVMSSIVRQPKAKWFVKNGAMNAIEPVNISPQALGSFQELYGILKANIMSLGAASDTSVAKAVDPGFGKTPEALKMQGERQGARDAWDTFMMEIFIERQYTIIADMLAKKGVKKYAFELVGESIKNIQKAYPDENYGNLLGKEWEKGKFSVDPEKIRGKYRFKLDPGSMTVKQDDTGEKIMAILDRYIKNPFVQKALAESGRKIDFGEAFERVMIDAGIKDSDKIIISQESPESIQGVGPDGATVEENISEENPEFNQEIIQ